MNTLSVFQIKIWFQNRRTKWKRKFTNHLDIIAHQHYLRLGMSGTPCLIPTTHALTNTALPTSPLTPHTLLYPTPRWPPPLPTPLPASILYPAVPPVENSIEHREVKTLIPPIKVHSDIPTAYVHKYSTV